MEAGISLKMAYIGQKVHKKPILLAFRVIQIGASMRQHFTPTRMTIATRRNNNIGKHKQKLGSSFTLIEMRSGAAALNAKYSGISSTECTEFP